MKHDKHAKLARTRPGTFHRTELAILGTPCGRIKALAYALMQALTPQTRLAYVDADHKGEDAPENQPALAAGAAMAFTDKISFKRFDLNRPLNEFQWRPFFQDYEAVLVNGNHFTANCQIAVVDPAKPQEKKLDRLTDVRLLLLKDTEQLPDYLQLHLADRLPDLPIYRFEETDRIIAFVRSFLAERLAPLRGLVLSGGQSTRMGTDKGQLAYHGRPQREHAYELLSRYTDLVYLSVNAAQAAELSGTSYRLIEDTFLGLGPLGGILSAFRQDPEAAWLVVACDLPLLSERSLDILVAGRDSGKMATAFYDSDHRFPEPLVTLWEPRAYPILLQFLSMGYSCPRKALINSDVALLDIPDVSELTNANDPQTREALQRLLTQR